MKSKKLQQQLLTTMQAQQITNQQVIQNLWSGYGEIVRITLAVGKTPTVIVKSIELPEEVIHPRGWNSDRSHQRKIKSYQVEMHWYQQWAERCTDACRVAKCYQAVGDQQQSMMILEDLDAAGYPIRKTELSKTEIKACLKWLANFHATFMNEPATGLWPIGSYWHLATRPDEYQVMADSALKDAAALIDQKLNNCHHQTLTHGDAKVANFCFSTDGSRVAAVDFQYVGAGCGMKDVAHLMGSCLDSSQCDKWQDELLDDYFEQLRQTLQIKENSVDWQALKSEWMMLYPYAWADFERFLLGWMPTHHKINSYSQSMVQRVLDEME